MTPADPNTTTINQGNQKLSGNINVPQVQIPSTNPTTQINIEASKNPSHPQFHINFGKVLATVMLGLGTYNAEQQNGNATNFLTNPTNLQNIIGGFASIWTS